MKKLVLCVLSIAVLVSCSSKPKKVAEAYKISDADVIAYITEANNIEKCLPNNVRLKSLDDNERRVLNGTKLDALTGIIGQYANKVWYKSKFYGGDKESNAYFEQKLIELNHKKTDVTKSECSVMKNKFAQRLNKYIAEVNYANSPQGRQQRYYEQQQQNAMFGAMMGFGTQAIQQTKQLDYWQQLEIEKAKAKAQQQKRTQTHTSCYNIGNQVYCDSTSY